MNTQKELKIIDAYIFNLYKNKEVCIDETINFLHVYRDYILKLNNLLPNNLTVDIFLVKKFEDNSLAFMEQDYKDPTRFSIYLQKDCLKAKNINDLDKIFLTLIDFGHEMQHIIQFIKTPKAMNKFFNAEMNYEQLYANSLVSKTLSRKTSIKLTKTLNRCNSALHLTAHTEKEADYESYSYVLELLDQILQNHNNDIDFINFMLEYIDKINFDKSDRKKQYKYFFEDYRKCAKVLQKKYGIKKEKLIIP